MRGVTFTASAAIGRAPLTVTTRPGTERPGMGTVSSGPTAIAIKYEGSGLVRANSTRVTAPVRRVAHRQVPRGHHERHGPGDLELRLVPAGERLARLGVLELGEEVSMTARHHAVERHRAGVERVVEADRQRVG